MVSIADQGAAEERGAPVNMPGLVVLILLIGAAGLYFRDGVGALLTAWSTPEYSHGPLIPILSALLFMHELKTLPEHGGPINGRWPGVAVVVFSLLLGALGQMTMIPDIVAYALIGFVAGVILTSMGWERGRKCWPAILHLAFMLPLPGILYWKVSTTLQFISSELGVWFIRNAGVPVFLDGNIIDLGVYKLHVAEACSGLRYLYPIMSFSYIFAALYRGPTWHKAVLLISAAPIAVFMNSVRIGIIGVVVDNYGLEYVEGITHFLEGWVIFIASILILFLMARGMLALQKEKMSLPEALDLDLTGLWPQFARLRLVRPSAALIVCLLATAGGVSAFALAPERSEPEIQRAPLSAFPRALGDWRLASTSRLEPSIEAVLGADDYFSGNYLSPAAGAARVEVFIAWYQDQTKGGIHSPEVCLPGGGWEMAEIKQVDRGSELGASSLPINRAIIQKGESRLLVYYWFEQYGGRTASDFTAKAELLRNAVLYGRTDGALMRLITPILPNESADDAEKRLIDAGRPLMEQLSRYVPSAIGAEASGG